MGEQCSEDRVGERHDSEGAKRYLNRRPLLEDWNDTDIALYSVDRVVNTSSYVSRGGKMGARRPPSAKLLIPQGEWRSPNSDGGARRNNLSLW